MRSLVRCGTPVLGFGLWVLTTASRLVGAETSLWPNAAIETDLNRDGVPDFWHRGGSAPGFDLWDATLSTSPTHSLLVRDTSASAYGEWYSDFLGISPGANCQLRYQRRYAASGLMRLSALFYDARDTYLAGWPACAGRRVWPTACEAG